MGLLFLAFPALEIWGLFYFGAKLGFVNTLFYLLAAAVLGFGLIRAQGVYLLSNFQSKIARGEVPENQIFSSLMVFSAGVLLVAPGFFSDVVALILLLPGTRHLVSYLLSKKIEKKIREGSFRMISFGSMGGFAAGFDARPTSRPERRELLEDIDVIDVTPIKPSDEQD